MSDRFSENVASLVQRKVPLTLNQIAILLAISKGEGKQTVRGLASGLSVSKPSITRAVDRLVRFGFVRRIPDGMDKRSVFIALTDTGAVLVNSLTA